MVQIKPMQLQQVPFVQTRLYEMELKSVRLKVCAFESHDNNMKPKLNNTIKPAELCLLEQVVGPLISYSYSGLVGSSLEIDPVNLPVLVLQLRAHVQRHIT